MYVQRNFEALYYSHCCSSKAISVTYSECVFVASGIQHAMRMRHNVICGLSGSTIYFHKYLINGTIFEKKIFNIKCVFWCSLRCLFEKFLILRRTERRMIIYVCWYLRKVAVILVRFSEYLNFLDIYSKNTDTSHFMKIRTVGDYLFHADRHGEADIRFSQFYGQVCKRLTVRYDWSLSRLPNVC